jgi:hypothetical protein
MGGQIMAIEMRCETDDFPESGDCFVDILYLAMFLKPFFSSNGSLLDKMQISSRKLVQDRLQRTATYLQFSQ